MTHNDEELNEILKPLKNITASENQKKKWKEIGSSPNLFLQKEKNNKWKIGLIFAAGFAAGILLMEFKSYREKLQPQQIDDGFATAVVITVKSE